MPDGLKQDQAPDAAHPTAPGLHDGLGGKTDAPPELSPATILVVDDFEPARFATRLVLERAGHHVVEAATGAEALHRAQESPDLIILDVHLPDMSGLDVCRQLKTDPATMLIPVLHLSAESTDTHAKVTGLKSGADGYLTQPVEDEELLASVLALLRLHKAEERLLEYQKTEAIGRLAGGIAHHFNNLMTTVIGFSRLGLDQIGEDHEVAGYLRDILAAGEEAAQLTRQLTIFAGKLPGTITRFDLQDLVRTSELVLRRLLGGQIELVVRPGPGPLQIEADQNRIEQALVTLAMNARDAMPAGGRLTIETGRVEIDVRFAGGEPGVVPGPHARLALIDTGRGIEPESIPLIFEPFYTTKGLASGPGLGLSVIQGIVRRSRGLIRVSSQPGKGSTFTVYLPLADSGNR